MDNKSHAVAKSGGHRYENGSVYVGSWNGEGHRQGQGHLLFPNGSRYDGNFEDGSFHGLGVLNFSDGAKYEGEFLNGWFHGHGVFWRADGMKHEGQYRGGKIWGLGRYNKSAKRLLEYPVENDPLKPIKIFLLDFIGFSSVFVHWDTPLNTNQNTIGQYQWISIWFSLGYPCNSQPKPMKSNDNHIWKSQY